MEDKWIWWMILDLCQRMIRMKDKSNSNIKIGRTNIMKIEILMVNMILTLDTISRIIDKDKWMINLIQKGNIITHHQKDSITRSKWMMMVLLNLKISNMNWIKLWIYMERMIIIITFMSNNLPIKITLITMMN